MRTILFLLIVLFLSACVDHHYLPKQRGYYNVSLPKHAYQSFAENGFPFQFEYPVYGTTVKDTLFFDKKPENPYWMNIEFNNELGGKIYLTYKTLNGKQDLAKKIEETYQMTGAHEKKADYINDPVFHTNNNVHGVFFEVGGNAASALQFFATDSLNHFLRGALYFDVSPNADSLKPANQFLRKDVEHLIKTLKWTK